MATTYSSTLGFALMATGENSGTWGTTTNTNLSPLIESSICGRTTASFTSDANLTISITDGVDSTGRYYILNCTSVGSLTATRDLICPLRAGKTYLVYNATTGSQSIRVIGSSGTGITVPTGNKAFVYCDGTNFVQAVDWLGNLTLGGTLGIGTTPAATTILDILQTQNSTSKINLTNASTGTAGIAEMRLSNSATNLSMMLLSTGYTPSGLLRADGVYFSSGGAGGITFNTSAAQPIYFGINNAEKMRLDASGNLGIGMTPARTLDVTGTFGVTGAATFNGRITQSLTPSSAEYALRSIGQTTGWIALDMSNTGGGYIIAGENSTGNNLIVGDSAYDMVIRGPSGISFSANAGSTQHMRLSSAGLLGIGKTPTYALDVSGRGGFDATLYLAPTNATYPTALNIARKSGADAIVFSNTATFNTSDSTGYNWFIGGTEVARFTTNGSLLIGVTTGGGTRTLVVSAAAGSSPITATQNGAGDYCFTANAVINAGNYYFCAFNGGTNGAIINNGTVTSYNATSDERMKDWTDIVQSDKRQMISDLWLGDFDIYDDFTKTGTPHRGFGVRAQQAYAVLGSQFGLSPPMSETDKWQAPSEPMAFLALWGVKDLYKIIDDLTTRLAALENK